MKIPNTSKDKPYIEFRICGNGNIKLSASSSWWGGKNSGFVSSDGTCGNSCEPKNLNVYVKAFKNKEIKKMKDEIFELQKKIKVFESVTDHFDF